MFDGMDGKIETYLGLSLGMAKGKLKMRYVINSAA